jgi:hypothetical protein
MPQMHSVDGFKASDDSILPEDGAEALKRVGGE